METSRKFLQTDFVDSIQIHGLSTRDDLERIASAGGVLAAIRELKEQKVARCIGITGHNDGAAMDFTPISESGRQKLQEKVAPARSAWENFRRTQEDSTAV